MAKCPWCPLVFNVDSGNMAEKLALDHMRSIHPGEWAKVPAKYKNMAPMKIMEKLSALAVQKQEQASLLLGKCPTCGADMAKHPECDICHILVGTGHLEMKLHDLKGKKVCSHCQADYDRYGGFQGKIE